MMSAAPEGEGNAPVGKVTLRRPARAMTRAVGTSSTSSASSGQTPVGIVFRTHTDSISKEAFLFSPKTLNVPWKSSASATGVPGGARRQGALTAAQSTPTQQNADEETVDCVIEVVPGAVPVAATGGTPSMPKAQSSVDVAKATGDSFPSMASSASAAAISTSSSYWGPNRGGWICRAFCGSEKHANHSAGALSVHHDLTLQNRDGKLLSSLTKGKATARVITFADAQQRYELSHVELTFHDQFVSRSDMFLISEALRDRILYMGEEILYEGFRLRVSDMLRPNAHYHQQMKNGSQTEEAPGSINNLSGSTSNALGGGASTSRLDYDLCTTGIVTANTKVNFQSLSFIYTIMIELSAEMWNPTIDGRTSLHWAIDRFLKEHSEHFPRYRSTPLIRLVIFGRLKREFMIEEVQSDIFHFITLTRSAADIQRLPDEASWQCSVVVEKLLSLFPDVDRRHPQALFVRSKESNLLQALNLVLEFYSAHHIDRRLDTTGQAITIVTAGKGFYQVTNDLAQITATKMLDIGIKQCAMICVGRPPLHIAPLFEYSSDDPTLRSQYQLQLNPRARERFYEQPLWASCRFYHPVTSGRPVGAALKFELLTKAQWEAEYPYILDGQHHYRPGLGLPPAPTYDVVQRACPLAVRHVHTSLGSPRPSAKKELTGSIFVRNADAPGSMTQHRFLSSYGRHADGFSTSIGRPAAGGGSLSSMGALFRGSSIPAESARLSMGSHRRSQGAMDRLHTVRPFVNAKWYKHMRGTSSTFPYVMSRSDLSTATASNLGDYTLVPSSNILDADLRQGNLKLELAVDNHSLRGFVWHPRINVDSALWKKFIACFASRDDRIALLESSAEATVSASTSRWDAGEFFSPSHTVVLGGKLIMTLRPVPHISFKWAEELMFSYDPDLFVSEGDLVRSGTPAVVSDGGLEASKGDSAFFTQPMAVKPLQKRGESDEMPDMMMMEGSKKSRKPLPGTSETIGSVQIRSSILFAIQPVNPFRPEPEVPSGPSSHSHHASGSTVGLAPQQSTDGPISGLDVYVSASQVHHLRWMNTHPKSPHSSSWQSLCRVAILPISGHKPVYSHDSSFEAAPTHYYIEPRVVVHNDDSSNNSAAIRAALTPLYLKEYILQRLHQQYQVVRHPPPSSGAPQFNSPTISERSESDITTVTTCPGSSWSRNLQPLQEVELTIGHQTHVVSVGEDGRAIHVKRQMHRGMYSASPSTHSISYSFAVLSHFTKHFLTREVRLEAQIGDRFAFQWAVLDNFLARRNEEIPSGPSLSLKDRQVCFAVLPADQTPDVSSSSGAMQTTLSLKRVPFEQFKEFITTRFSKKLKPREGDRCGQEAEGLWRKNDAPLCFAPFDPNCLRSVSQPSSPSAFSINAINASTVDPFFESPKLRTVVLEHHKDDPSQCPDAVLRRPVDPSTGHVHNKMFVDDRVMDADIDLSEYYHEECAFILRLSWLSCASTIISDWTRGLTVNASKYGLKIVPIPCSNDVTDNGNVLLSHFHAEPPLLELDIPFREALMLKLARGGGYYPEVQTLNGNCRMIHASGLCVVASLPSRSGLTWSENFVFKSGSMEQKNLFDAFHSAFVEVSDGMLRQHPHGAGFALGAARGILT